MLDSIWTCGFLSE